MPKDEKGDPNWTFSFVGVAFARLAEYNESVLPQLQRFSCEITIIMDLVKNLRGGTIWTQWWLNKAKTKTQYRFSYNDIIA